MADVEQEIAALREDAARQGRTLAQAEQQVAVHEGRLTAALGDLQTEFGVGSIDAARVKAGRVEAALRAEVVKMRDQLVQAGGQT